MLSTCPPDNHLYCCTLGVGQLHGSPHSTARPRPVSLWGQWQLQDSKDVYQQRTPSHRLKFPGCLLVSTAGACRKYELQMLLDPGRQARGGRTAHVLQWKLQDGQAHLWGWRPAASMVGSNVVTCSQRQGSALRTVWVFRSCRSRQDFMISSCWCLLARSALQRSLAVGHPGQCTKQMVQAYHAAVYACSRPSSSAIINSVSPEGICCSFRAMQTAPRPFWGRERCCHCDEDGCRALQVWQLRSASGPMASPHGTVQGLLGMKGAHLMLPCQ